jgi:hypothetical protein
MKLERNISICIIVFCFTSLDSFLSGSDSAVDFPLCGVSCQVEENKQHYKGTLLAILSKRVNKISGRPIVISILTTDWKHRSDTIK